MPLYTRIMVAVCFCLLPFSVNAQDEGEYRSLIEVGTVVPYAGVALDPETGWLAADGSCISQDEYIKLYEIIGTIYDAGLDACDPDTEFQLPDLRGRVVAGVGVDFWSQSWVLGQQAGDRAEVLTIDQIPPHTHGISRGSGTAGTGTGQISQNLFPNTVTNAWQTASVGGSAGVTNPIYLYQPTTFMNYMIWSGAVEFEFPESETPMFDDFWINPYIPAAFLVALILVGFKRQYQALIYLLAVSYAVTTIEHFLVISFFLAFGLLWSGMYSAARSSK